MIKGRWHTVGGVWRFRRRAFWSFVFLGALCVLCGETVFAYEIRAERMETVQEGGAVRRTYTGRVEALLDSVSVRSAQAVYSSATEEVVFSGGVEAVDGARRAVGDTLVYALKARRAIVSGGVLVTEGGRELRAARVVLLRGEDRVEAAGGVEAWYPERGTRLRADTLEVASGGDSGIARGGARLVRTDTDTFAMAAKAIRFARGGERAEGEEDVEMTVGGFVARCSRAVCDSDSVAMAGAPVLNRFRERSDGAEHSEVRAAQVGLSVAQGSVRRLTATGDARVVQRRFDTVGAPSGWSRLEGDTLVVEVERGEMRHATSEGGAKSVSRDADSSEVEMTAGRITVLSEEGRVRRVRGEGQGRASHRSADGSERSALAGDAIEIEMEGDRMGGVLLQGHAVCEYLPDERTAPKRGGKSRLSGDRIGLALQGGEVKRATGEGGVVGAYWMTEEERGKENAK